MSRIVDVDIREWAKRNMAASPIAGTMAMRNGIRLVSAVSASDREYVGGFTVQNEFTGEVWHYIFRVATTAPRGLTLLIMDEDYVIFQEKALNVDVVPRVITFAVVQGQIVIASPDIPTLHGMVGSCVNIAVKVARTDGSATAIDVPRGIVCAFLNRVVIADGSSLYFSDPLSTSGPSGALRTFVGQNQNARPGAIYGLHEGAGGMLVTVTSTGTYGLPPDAGSVGIVGSNGAAWQLLSHAKAWTFASSCVVNGRVWALTVAGYKLVDVEGDAETVLSDPPLCSVYYVPAVSADWRTSRMLGGDAGPIVCDETNVAPTTSFHDLASGLRSWWTRPVNSQNGALSVRGLLYGGDGEEYLLCAGGIFRVRGNFDGSAALSSGDQFFGAAIAGIVPTSPTDNSVVRAVHVACASEAGDFAMAVNGDTSIDDSANADDGREIRLGTTLWSSATRFAKPRPLKGRRCVFDMAGNEIHVAIQFYYGGTRIQNSINVEFSDSAPTRPVKRGN